MALDKDMDFSNGVTFFTNVFDQAADVTSSVLILPVLNLFYSSNETKTTFTMKADLKLAQATVVQNSFLIVQFPWYDFDSAMIQGFKPSCTFTKMGDASATPYITGCTYFVKNRVKLALKADSENTLNELVYQVSISNIPTPY